VKRKYKDSEYLHDVNPLDGDMDGSVRCETVRLVKLRKERTCSYAEDGHTIKPGEYSRCQKGIIDGQWGRFDICIPCLDKELDELNGFGDCHICKEYTQVICPSCKEPTCSDCFVWGGNICTECGDKLNEWGCS
jgi:hypothetical protein